MSERVLITGGGGREHALAWKLDKSPLVEEIFVAPGNAGTMQHWENVPIAADNPEAIIEYALNNKIDLAVLGPDASVAAGTADACAANDIACFGPSKQAGRLEWDNEDAYNFMRKYGIPCPEDYYGTNQMTHANSFINSEYPEKYVIRVQGLADGQGVLLPNNKKEALDFIQKVMVERAFGKDNTHVMFQERLVGPELSLFVLADGRSYLWLPHCRDHKPIFDGNKGPNGGGMGVTTPIDVDPKLNRQFNQDIIVPTLDNLVEEGRPYNGVLYVGIILTPNGPKVIEYNARFGDPEGEALMPMIDEDLYPRLQQVTYGNIDPTPIKTREGYVATVALTTYLDSDEPRKNKEIHGLELTEDLAQDEIYVFHGGTKIDEVTGKTVTNGNRPIHIAAYGKDQLDARQKAYGAIGKHAIHFDDMHYRHDIDY